MNTDFELSNLPNLESVYIGAGSFCDLKSFTLSHNPKLKIFETEDGYEEDDEEDDEVKECTFRDVNQFVLSGNYEKLLIYWIDLPSLTTLKFGLGSFFDLSSLIIDSTIVILIALWIDLPKLSTFTTGDYSFSYTSLTLSSIF